MNTDDAPMVMLTDNETGEELTEEDMVRKLTAADTTRMQQEMMHVLHAMLLPESLFLRGSEFRYFVEKYNQTHDVPASVFTIGGKDFPLPRYWPDDPIHDVVFAAWAEVYVCDHPEGFSDADVVAATKVVDTLTKRLTEYVALYSTCM